MHLFSFPEKETFGVAYVEAMAAGLPVIACRSGGTGRIHNTSDRLVDRRQRK